MVHLLEFPELNIVRDSHFNNMEDQQSSGSRFSILFTQLTMMQEMISNTLVEMISSATRKL